MRGRYGVSHICGCYYNGPSWQRVYLAQVNLDTHVTITPVCFTTKLTQTFRHSNTTALENVRYAFPLYDGVAVNSFSVKIGDKTLSGIVQQKDTARKTYQAAVDRNETAGLLEALPNGVFGITIGNVPTKVDVIVEIQYSGELSHDAGIDGLRFILPTSIAPRYGEYPGEVMTSTAVAGDGMKIVVDLDMAKSVIRKVQSPTHNVGLEMGKNSTPNGQSNDTTSFDPSLASISLAAGSAEIADDFVVQVIIDDIGNPRALLEEHPTLSGQRAIMATLVPKFTLPMNNPEIVFIADQSGSMAGGNNTALVSALKVFLKSLPFGVRFNICAFGSHHEFLWPKSQAYNEKNVEEALKYTSTFGAGMGGTEMYPPVEATFKNHLPKLPLEIIILTDGAIYRETKLFDLINEQIRDKKVDARVFTLGIGTAVSHTLVNSVARAGNGFAQFVTDNEEIDAKVMRMLKAALYAHTSDYQLEVHYGGKEAEDDGFELVEKVQDCLRIKDFDVPEKAKASKNPLKVVKSFFETSPLKDQEERVETADENRYAHLPMLPQPAILQSPYDIPSMHPSSRTTVYLLLGPESPCQPITSITLRATSGKNLLELNIPVQIASQTGVTIHALAARKAIQDLEEGRGWLESATLQTRTRSDDESVRTKYASRFDELVEREIVQLGERYQVASKFTSFVAVEEKPSEEEEDLSADASEKASSSTSHISKKKKMTVSTPEGPLSLEGPHSLQTLNAPRRSTGGQAPRMQLASCAARKSAPATPGRGRQSQSQAQRHRILLPSSLSSVGDTPDSLSESSEEESGDDAAQASRFLRCQAESDEEDEDEDEDMGFGLFGDDESSTALPSYASSASALMSAPQRMSVFSASAPPPSKTQGMRPFCVAQQQARPPSLHDIIGQQEFSGAWKWSPALLQSLGLDVSSIKMQDFGDDETIAATALVLAWLQVKQGTKKDVWEMIAAKARTQLAGSALVANGVKVESLINKAVAYF